MSNTVNFICHLITSVGHCSHPPGSAWQTLFSTPTVGPGRGTRSADPGSPQGRKGSTLTLLQPPSAARTRVLGPPTQLPFQTLPARGVEGLLGTSSSWLQPCSHAPSFLACPPYQPARPLPGVGGQRVCPPLTGSALAPGVDSGCPPARCMPLELWCVVGAWLPKTWPVPFCLPAVAPTWAQR